jgi:hypothetical protein
VSVASTPGFLAILRMNPAFALSARVLTGTNPGGLTKRLNIELGVIMATDLPYFLAYFSDGTCMNFQAASFKADFYNQKLRFKFFLEAETQANIYLDPKSVEAIIPIYKDQKYDGQVFRIRLKSGTEISVRAAYFRFGTSSLWFYEPDNDFIENIYVAEDSVWACVPSGTVPPKPPPFKAK